MNMVKTINGWVQVRNNFVRKVGENVYHVIRLENSETQECTHVDIYYKVNLNDVTKDTFSRHGEYTEYLNEKTDEEKAVYTANFGLNYDESFPCDNNNEITNTLVEDNVIPKGEIFKIAL
jgi:hypothetical protein